MERDFLGGLHRNPNFAPAHDACIRSFKGFPLQAARAVGSSDGGVISIRPRGAGPLAVVGHLSMYIQTETMSLSLIPTRGAACRREPLERARSNRRASRWTGSGRRHAGISQEKENLRCVPGVPGAVAWRTEVLQAEFRVRKACRKKDRPPVPNRKGYRKRPGNGVFGGMVSEPEFRRRAPRAPPGSFKGFMRTMPPGRWGTAIEISFLFGGFL